MSKPDIKFKLSLNRISESDRKLIEEQPDRYKKIVLSTPVRIIVEEVAMVDMSLSQLNEMVSDIEKEISDPEMTEDGIERTLKEAFEKPYIKKKLADYLKSIKPR